MADREPDSDFADGIGVDRAIWVGLTEPFDFPSGGAFTVRLRFSKFQSTTLKIRREEALSLRDQLNKLTQDGVL